MIGPVEAGTATAVRPFRETVAYFAANDELRQDVAELSAQNSKLRSEAEQAPLDRNRLAELDGLTGTANQTGYALVAARVVGMGPMQSFSRTVTIDAGTTSGVRKDMTVLNNDGLVGRVISTTRSTANVLLILDTDSVVGGRLGSNSEIGFLRGRGVTGERGRLDLDLVDHSVTPAQGRLGGHLGQPERRALRRRDPHREGGVGVLHPARAGQARRDRPVRRLHGSRRRRCRRTAQDRGRPTRDQRPGQQDRRQPMNISRTGMVGLVIVLAVVLQVAVFNLFAVNGVVPNLALIVVVAAAIARGPQFGAVVGFTAGLLLDLAPPADHVAGRWALALVLVAILAGRVRDDARRSPIAALATVAVCSFVATSVFALSGVVLVTTRCRPAR